uniref:NAD(P)H-quinone oxidoreductase subunit 3, chloroplastic n=1 Tax=Rhodobryum laxelimbatum TaxID=576390 RepID=A0A7T7BXI2_9BRYO|nr:NdhC [Rhodobryum laxelimbatum]QQK56280.1 NdhC [Rhodobryum laxelimbatum]
MFLLPKYNSFFLFLLIASSIPILTFFLSNILAPVGNNNKRPEKFTGYESGIEPMGDAWIQFQIRYYMFALVFVIFDIETVFLYPWAMSFTESGLSAFIEALVFVSISIIGSVYAWRKGALEWS